MKHNVVYVFVILVDDVYCVAIHDLSPVLTALFFIELGGFNSQHNGGCMNWGINQMTKTLNTEIPKTKSKTLNDIQLTFT